MPGIDATSLAAGIGVGIENVQFQPGVNNLPRKIAIIGTFDPTKTDIVAETPLQVFSAEDVGDKCGFGFNIHRLAVHSFLGGQGVETWIIPQAETGVQATAIIDITASGVQAGTVYLYIGDVLVQAINVVSGDTDALIAAKIVAAINAQTELRVTAAVNVTELYEQQVILTEKSKGLCGNFTSILFNLGAGETTPTGITFSITDMSGGSGTPDIQDALDALGTGDGANEDFFTDVIHGYGTVTAVLNAVRDYVGAGNTLLGLYKNTVARPFRSLVGDTAAGSAGLTAITAISDGRKTDRATGSISAPGAPGHPDEIAAQAVGHAARINQNRAAQSALGVALIGFHTGEKADRWTTEYENRDLAVKAGAGTTAVENGVLVIQNLITFYHPDSVPVDSNAYRSYRNISIQQNVAYNIRLNFSQDKWKGVSIVSDLAKVTNVVDRQKTKDIDAVIEDLVILAQAMAGKAWLYQSEFTVERLRTAGYVTVRSGGLGFTSIFPFILSGEAGIFDNQLQVDTSIAILTA